MNGNNGAQKLERGQKVYTVFLVKSTQSIPYDTKNETISFEK